MAKRDKTAETEKITINLGPVDLGRIDLLVQEGFFTNRTDFIRTAIRTQLAAQSNEIDRSVARHQLEMGLYDFLRADLEALRDRGEMLHIRVVGLAESGPLRALLLRLFHQRRAAAALRV